MYILIGTKQTIRKRHNYEFNKYEKCMTCFCDYRVGITIEDSLLLYDVEISLEVDDVVLDIMAGSMVYLDS